MQTITGLETAILRLPYRRVVSFKSMAEDSGEYVLLRLKLSDGQEGIAESVTRPLQTGDDGRILAHVLSTFLAPMVVGLDPLGSAQVVCELYEQLQTGSHSVAVYGCRRSARTRWCDHLVD